MSSVTTSSIFHNKCMGRQFHSLMNTGQGYCHPRLRKTFLWYVRYVLVMKSSSVNSYANSCNSGISSMWTVALSMSDLWKNTELWSYWWTGNCVLMGAVKNKTPVNPEHKIWMRGCSGKWAYIDGTAENFKY